MEQLVWCIISGLITLALAVVVVSLVFSFVPEGKISVTAYLFKNALIVSVRAYGNKKIYIYDVELLNSKGEPVKNCRLVFARVDGKYIEYSGKIELMSGQVLRLYYNGEGCRYVEDVIVKTNVGQAGCMVINLLEST